MSDVLQSRVLRGVVKGRVDEDKKKADVSTSPINININSHWTHQTGTEVSEGGISAFERGLNLLSQNSGKQLKFLTRQG